MFTIITIIIIGASLFMKDPDMLQTAGLFAIAAAIENGCINISKPKTQTKTESK